MFHVYVIHSAVTRHFNAYMVKTRGCPVVVLFCKKNHFTESIVRKYGAEFQREENVGENQNGIVQYLLIHL